MLDRTPCLRRWVASSTTSPNQVGVEATNSAEVWMITDPSAILVICASLREWGCFSLSKSHIFIPARYMLVPRCASRGNLSFRQRFEPSFHIYSALDLCHSCSLRSTFLLSSKRWSAFICCVSWLLPTIVRLACIFSSVQGSQSSYTSRHRDCLR